MFVLWASREPCTFKQAHSGQLLTSGASSEPRDNAPAAASASGSPKFLRPRLRRGSSAAEQVRLSILASRKVLQRQRVQYAGRVMARRSGTRFTIYAALVGNCLVALTKFVA